MGEVIISLHARFCRPWMLPVVWTAWVLCAVAAIYFVCR
jgi:hypothetical protein